MTQIEQNNFGDLISVAEGGKVSGYNQDYLSALCRRGKIRGLKIGRNWTVFRSALQAFVQDKLQFSLKHKGVPLEVQSKAVEFSGNIWAGTQDDIALQLIALRERVKADIVLRRSSSADDSLCPVEGQSALVTDSITEAQEINNKLALVELCAVTDTVAQIYNFQTKGLLSYLITGVVAFSLFAFFVNLAGPRLPLSSPRVVNGTKSESKLLQSNFKSSVQNFSVVDLNRLVLSNSNQVTAASWLQTNSLNASRSLQVDTANSNLSIVLTDEGVYAPIYFYHPVSASPATGGSVFSAADLSAQYFTTSVHAGTDTQSIRIFGSSKYGGSSLVVTGELRGVLAGLVDPNFTEKHMPFQGVSGLSGDDNYFFYDVTKDGGVFDMATVAEDVSTHPLSLSALLESNQATQMVAVVENFGAKEIGAESSVAVVQSSEDAAFSNQFIADERAFEIRPRKECSASDALANSFGLVLCNFDTFSSQLNFTLQASRTIFLQLQKADVVFGFKDNATQEIIGLNKNSQNLHSSLSGGGRAEEDPKQHTTVLSATSLPLASSYKTTKFEHAYTSRASGGALFASLDNTQ